MGSRGGSQTNGLHEFVEIVDDALIQTVELRPVLAVERSVALDRREQAGSQRRVDALEELQEDEADRIALGQEPVAAGVRQLFDETFGAQFEPIVAQGRERVLLVEQPRAWAV